MVGFSPDKTELPVSWYGYAGAISGAFTRATVQPLDVLKIRFQIHLDPIKNSPTSKYQGILHACRRIYCEEGIFAFWKGHVPAQALSIIYGIAQFAAFEYLTKSVWHRFPSYLTTDIGPITHFACGGLAGGMATVVCQPCDVIRTRFVTQGQQKVYTSLLHACQSMMVQEGPASFYRGLVPALLQVVPQTALQFGSYTLLTEFWKKTVARRSEQTGEYNIGGLESLVCGSGSGLFSKLLVYPLDVTKKRLQVQGFEKGWSNIGKTQKYNGLLHCLRSVLLTEGIVGLYKGLSPSLVKAAIVTAISFWTYEQILKCMVHIKHK